MTLGNALLSAAEMSRADARAATCGVSTLTLMRNAGLAVADAASCKAPKGRIVVIAGRGNNGGDGFVAAQELTARGFDVAVMLFCRRESLKGDAAIVAGEWQGPLLPFEPDSLGSPALIIDALFGAGLNRPAKGDALAMIAAINASGAPILSVDLPSGINADTGAVMGDAVRATQTVTFFRRKPGHLLLPGRVHCGRLAVVQIGIEDGVLDAIAPQSFANGPDLWRSHFPVPKIDGHKFSRGHALVLSGGRDATGAARLAARAALRAGAGLVTVASPADALAINATALTAVMVREVDSSAALAAMLEDTRINAAVIGPGAGVGERTRDMVLRAVAAGRGLVLDADALTSFAQKPDELFNAITKRRPGVVMTPHTGEFKRLFSNIKNESKLESARQAALRSFSVVVLKGPDTVIASPDGRVVISDNAPPWLATAGAGDVLSGFIAGFLAQGVPAFEAACMGVWMHGQAAQAFGPGLIAEDLPDVLPSIMQSVLNSLEQ